MGEFGRYEGSDDENEDEVDVFDGGLLRHPDEWEEVLL